MNTFVPGAAAIERKWFVVDAEGKTLGRLATEIARILRGKHKPIFTPYLDTGDYVIVVNAENVFCIKIKQGRLKPHFGYS